MLRPKVRLGYFPDWADEPTILFSASDPAAIVDLGDIFRSLASGAKNEVEIHELGFVTPHHNVKITARVSVTDEGMQKVGEGNVFKWSTTPAYWCQFAELLSVLWSGEEAKQGHEYLDCGLVDDIQVVVSLNEYSDEFWEEFG